MTGSFRFFHLFTLPLWEVHSLLVSRGLHAQDLAHTRGRNSECETGRRALLPCPSPHPPTTHVSSFAVSPLVKRRGFFFLPVSSFPVARRGHLWEVRFGSGPPLPSVGLVNRL